MSTERPSTRSSRTLEGLARSLVTKRQRQLLDDAAARIGIQVVYLKSAWADPVLYGGRGERWGTDVDVLVEPRAFEAFAEELSRLGFRRQPLLAHHALRGAPFRAPGGLIDVDLHHALGPRPWFPLDEPALLARAHAWESVDGPIVGLCADDQVVHAVAHHAGDRFTLDGRHTTDIARLLARQNVDWERVTRTCLDAHLGIALHLFARMLRAMGTAAPEVPLTGGQRLRLRALERLFNLGKQRRFWTRSRTANIRLELLVLLPLLSTRRAALPHFVAGALRARM